MVQHMIASEHVVGTVLFLLGIVVIGAVAGFVAGRMTGRSAEPAAKARLKAPAQSSVPFAYVVVGLLVLAALGVSGWSAVKMFTVEEHVHDDTHEHAAGVMQPTSEVSLPANIQSSAPMKFNSVEEEIEYMKKNAKNPNNIDVEKAVRNMDENLDGLCDTCGMAILHCIEQGMEDM